jgi:hypothetical protein
VSVRALCVAAGVSFACSVAAMAAEERPFVEVPVGARPAHIPDLVQPVLPPVTEGSARAMEVALVAVVREFCINGIGAAETDVQAAARVAAVPVPDPWHGQRFLWATPRTTWSLPSTPRLFFWLGESEIDGFRECQVLAFEGDRMQLARTALDVLERHAEERGFGAPEHEVRPLEDLGRRGVIDRVWEARDFSASIAEDRGDPALIGLHVSVHARPAVEAAATHRDVGREAVRR